MLALKRVHSYVIYFYSKITNGIILGLFNYIIIITDDDLFYFFLIEPHKSKWIIISNIVIRTRHFKLKYNIDNRYQMSGSDYSKRLNLQDFN